MAWEMAGRHVASLLNGCATCLGYADRIEADGLRVGYHVRQKAAPVLPQCTCCSSQWVMSTTVANVTIPSAWVHMDRKLPPLWLHQQTTGSQRTATRSLAASEAIKSAAVPPVDVQQPKWARLKPQYADNNSGA